MKKTPLIILCLLFLAGAAASNAVMDTLAFRYQKSVFSQDWLPRAWWDPGVSWKNKWKNGDPQQGEAFPFSSTALVATTDAWHCFKAIAIFCILAAILLPFSSLFQAGWPVWAAVFIGLKLAYGLVFEGLFAHIFLR